MSDAFTDRTPEAVSLEVRAYRHGKLVHRELCESEDAAALAVDAWSDFEDVECRVVDLTGPDQQDHPDGEPAGLPGPEEEFPESTESDRLVAESRRFSD